MFKIAAIKVRNGYNGIVEEFFANGEKDFAVNRALALEAAGHLNVVLLEITQARSKVAVPTKEIVDLKFVTRSVFRTASKFAVVPFAAPKPKTKAVRKPKAVVVTAAEFDLPPATTAKRVSKRVRTFGVEADKTVAAAV